MTEESRLAIAIDSRGAEQNVRNIRGELAGLEKQGIVTTQTLRRTAAGVVAAGTAAAGALALLTKQGMAFADEQAKTADRIGATIDGLRASQIAANDAGIASQTLAGDLARMNRELVNARDASSRAGQAIKSLGLDANTLINSDADQRLALIAGRVEELGLNSAETGDLLRDLGIRNEDMINLLMGGADAFANARQEVDDYGLSLSRVDAARVEQANDALARIPRVLEPIRNQIAIALAEPLTDVADRFNQAARDSNGFAAEVVEAMGWAADSTASLLEQINGVRTAYLRIKELDLNLQAALEVAQNFVTGSTETPAMDALENVRQTLQDIEQGNTGLQRFAEEARATAQQIRDNYAARQEERDELVSTTGSLQEMGDAATEAGSVLRGLLPTNEQGSAPGIATPESVGLNLRSITPMSADQFPVGGVDYSNTPLAATQAILDTPQPQSAGQRHTVNIEVNGDSVGEVEADDRFASRLADALSNAAAAV